MDTKSFLKQLAEEIHKPVKKKFKRRKVYVEKAYDTFSIDLADMNMYKDENNGYRYMLVCIDVFSRYLWIQPIKTKHADVVLEAFKKC